MPLSTKQTLTLVLSCAVLAESAECGPSRYIVYHFQSRSCPDSASVLPDSAKEGEYRLSSRKPGSFPQCGRFQLYDIERHTKRTLVGQSGVYIRLNRRTPCGVDVILRYDPRDDPEPSSFAEVINRMVQPPSDTLPNTLPITKDTLESMKDFKTWCARRPDIDTAASTTAPSNGGENQLQR